MFKQVIVMRTDLNMRKGKMAVQAAHAAIGSVFEQDIHSRMNRYFPRLFRLFASSREELERQMFWNWYENGMPKICVGIPSEEGLIDVISKAKNLGLRVTTVNDAGKTELEPGTLTCCAIGPNTTEMVDRVTGGLKLL